MGRLKSSEHRFIANHGDATTLQQLSSGISEQIGRKGWVRRGEQGRNLFSFEQGGKL